jgi:hypothetical protein
MGIRVDGLRDGCYQFQCSRYRRIFFRFFGSPRAKSRGFPNPSGVGVPERFQEVFLKRLRWTAAVLLVSTVSLLNGCSSSTGQIPTPSIGSISPDSITAGSADFTLFISGNGLEADTVGFLDGTSRPTKFNQTTGQVEMSITAADVAVPDASVQVTVANPSPGGTSNALTLIVNPVANGAPAITGFNPPSAAAGTMGPFTVSVAGTGFVQTSVVNWDGSPRATTFVSSTQLTVNFTTQDLATAGSGSISVSNPAPGGGVSPSKNFPVN